MKNHAIIKRTNLGDEGGFTINRMRGLMHDTVDNGGRVVTINKIKSASPRICLKKSVLRRLRRYNYENLIKLRVCLGCDGEYNR